MIDFDVEPLLFSDYISKMTRYNNRTERILILTTVNIYNFKKKSIRRKVPIAELGAIVKSLSNQQEFILHFPNSYDLRF